MKTPRWQNWSSAIFISLLIIFSIVLRVDQTHNHREYKLLLSLDEYQWIYITLLLICGFLLLVAIFYKNSIVQFSAWVFPIILLIGIGINIGSFREINQQGIWHLQRLPANSLVDLVQASPRKERALYLLIEKFYSDKVLLIPPGFVEEDELLIRLFENWGRLESVNTLEYNPNLSEQEMKQISSFEQKEFYTEEKEYIFVIEKSSLSDTIAVMYHNGQRFFVPLNTLPDRVFTP